MVGHATITSQVIDLQTVRADDECMQNGSIDLETAQRLIDDYLACWNAPDPDSEQR